MSALVLDTHTAIWFLQGSPQLSTAALTTIRAALAAGDFVRVSTVSVVELTYLVEKGRVPAPLLDQLLMELRRPDAELLITPFDLDMAEILRTVPRSIRDSPIA